MYKELIEDKKDYIQMFWNTAISQYVKLPNWVITIIGSFGYFYHDKQFVEEVKAISQLSGLSFQQVFFANFADEFGSGNKCTSIVAQNDQNELFHARNWDYGMVDILLNLTVHAQYYKNGNLLYEADLVAGMVGLITAYKPNSFSITVNNRQYGSELSIVWSILQNKAFNVPYLVRKTVETQENYESAIEFLSTTNSDCPVYLIICGVNPGEGSVITKGVNTVQNFTPLNLSQNKWYIVQTNYDRNDPDPPLDPRRTAAEANLEKLGRNNLTYDSLYNNIITQFPNFNNYTILTAMFQPSSNTFNTTMWNF